MSWSTGVSIYQKWSKEDGLEGSLGLLNHVYVLCAFWQQIVGWICVSQCYAWSVYNNVWPCKNLSEAFTDSPKENTAAGGVTKAFPQWSE